MTLPFSHDDFLDLFGAYNAEYWPAALLLWLATGWLGLRALRGSPIKPGVVFGVLALHWAWSGVAYHWMFFRRINPAATIFAVAFVVEAVLLMWRAGSGTLCVARSGVSRVVGAGLLIYGLAYPFIGLAMGLRYPRLPVFAVPCPTTLVTAGLLLMLSNVPAVIKFVPIAWAFFASSAAIVLGIWADLALVVAGVALTVDALPWPLTASRRASTHAHHH